MKLDKILLSAILVGNYGVNTSFAAEGDEEIDNELSLNQIEVFDFSTTFNGATSNHDGSYTFSVGENSASKNIAYNTMTINGGKFIFNINGGNYSGNLKNNTFTLNGGYFSFDISDSTAYKGNITNNTFNINGGTLINSYYSMPSATASGNTVNISGSPDLSNAYIYAGFLGDVENYSGNSLNFNSNNLSAKNIYDFNNLNFYLPSSTANGTTALTLTDGATDISNAAVTAVVAGGTTLTTGDTVNLISNSNGLTSSGASFDSRFAEGVTVTYDSELAANGNSLVLTVGNAKVEEQTRALSQGVINISGVVSRGTDRIIDWLPPEEFNDVMTEDESEKANVMAAAINNSFGLFANMDGSKLRTKTGNGSYVDSKGGGMDMGLARAVENQSGDTIIFAPLFDYGKNDYDSYLSNGTHGTGTSRYLAGGLIGRKMLKNGFYYEGSFRGGKAKTTFYSSDFMQGPHRIDVNYSASAPVFAGHIRLGKLLRMNRDNLLHIYGIYAHNHINGMDTTLSTGEHYDFSAIDSGRLRLGYRLTTRVSSISRIYTGLAYQYEFNGSTEAKYRMYTTPDANIKGSSGLLEIGWQIKPSTKTAWMVDLNATGWAGLQKGITFMAKAKKSF